MKKIIFKVLIIFILIITMFEFIFSSNISNANIISEDAINTVTSLSGGIMSIIYWDKRLLATGLAFIMDNIISNLAEADGTSYGYSGLFSIITPFEVFFNKYKILDINFFDLTSVDSSSISYMIRQAVAKWFYIMRIVASAILLVILIYIGIRMALASIAEEKAKYRKMLMDWCCSLLLIFILQYIAIFAIYCNNAIVNALASTITDNSTENAIGNIITGIGLNAIIGVGITSIVSVLVFCAIVFQSLGFFVAYINRMIKIGFLIIISPLISLTYAIDKIGDGKAQALGSWLKEFVYTILIQPFHCILYLAFIRTAFSLIVGASAGGSLVSSGLPGVLSSLEYNQLVNGVLAILCLKFVKDGEKIIRTIFGFKDDNSSTSFAGGLAVSMIAIKNAQKIGTTARKGINFATNKGKTVSKAFKHDSAAFKKTNTYKKLSESAVGKKMGEIGSKASNLENKVTNSSIGSKVISAGKEVSNFGSKTINKAKTLNDKYKSSKLGDFMKKRKFGSLSTTLGIMGASMAYMSGDMSGLEAFALGKGLSSGAAGLFNTSKGAISDEIATVNTNEDMKDYAKLQAEVDKDKKALEDTDMQAKYANLISQYEEAQQKAQEANTEAETLEEEAKAEQDNADTIKAGFADGQTTSPEYEETLKRVEEKKRQAEAKRQAETNFKEIAVAKKEAAEKLDDEEHYGGRLALLYKDSIPGEDGKLSNEFGEAMDKRKEALVEFWDSARAGQRLKDRSRGVSTSELQAKKNQIIELLTKMKLQQGDGTFKENILTSDEQDSIERTAIWLTDNIEYGVLTDNAFDISNEQTRGFIEQSIGIKRGTSAESDTFNTLKQATSDFESLQASIKISEQFKKYSSVGGDQDSLTEASAEKTSRKGREYSKNRTSK